MKLALALAFAVPYLVAAQDEEGEEEEVVVATNEPSTNCLYCRKQDSEAGWLLSYSYCVDNDECLMDAWNYLDRPCESDWTRAKSFDIGYCNANSVTGCAEFESTPDDFGVQTNRTYSLAGGEYCIVKVDATQALARVIFDESSDLGIESEEFGIMTAGKVYDVQSGVFEFTVFNAEENGTRVNYIVSFSGAIYLGAAVLAGIVPALLVQ